MDKLEDLQELFDDLNQQIPSKEHLEKFYEIYNKELSDDYIEIGGDRLTFKSQKSWVKEFEGYPETFVHLITKEQAYGKPRVFDSKRANRIHWVKCILSNIGHSKILFFEKKDKDDILKKYYWYKEKKFVVILKPIKPKILLVTAFCVEKTKEMDFEYDYKKFHNL
ncbi:hypothetical protein [Elizabethkingia anophelis]|uniref:hypothetical protein n=1 Tax=Elizabethkingia anophelis TaxID=1117645 RepID=UPI00200FFB96|nr:hypothetical protein [Elizabethkingia anophelis]MCL1034675.1 hypothetical protein [Elizabethkingia anophelis]